MSTCYNFYVIDKATKQLCKVMGKSYGMVNGGKMPVWYNIMNLNNRLLSSLNEDNFYDRYKSIYCSRLLMLYHGH